MFSGRKDDKAKGGQQRRRGNNLAQFGLMEVPDIDGLNLGGEGSGDDDNDADLEAELLALTGGGGAQKPRKRGKPVVAAGVLDKMVNECMRDDYDDEMVDEDDPELLAELSALSPGAVDDDDLPPAPTRPAPTPPNRPSADSPANDYRNPEPYMPRQKPMAGGSNLVSLLGERIAMYKEAEANAKESGETSRARRFNRGLKTLLQMEKSAKAGRPINEEDIPPAVVVKSFGRGSGSSSAGAPPTEDSMPPPPVPPHIRDPSVSPSSILHDVAFQDPDAIPSEVAPRLPPKKQNSVEGNRPTVPPLQRTTSSSGGSLKRTISLSGTAGVIQARQTEYKMAALAAKKRGDKEAAVYFMRVMKRFEPLIAAAESGQVIDLASLPGPPGDTVPQASTAPAPAPPAQSKEEPPSSVPEGPNTPAGDVPNASGVAAPTSVLEALEQRLAKYTEQRDKAKSEENSRKERMNQRIMKQYQDAIKYHKAGKPVEYDELPTPPGFPPIPVGGSKPAPSPAAPVPAAPSADAEGSSPPKQPRVAAPQPPAAQKAPAPTPNVRNAPQSRVEKQLAFLVKRQGQFKQAALEAKKRGEIEQAKEYLRMSKGFDQLIEATKGGLPVDMNTVPVPPQEQVSPTNIDFEVVNAEDCVIAPPHVSGDITIIYTKLEEDLIAQIKMCAQTREHFKATGDVASSNRFEQLIVHTKKDLDAVRAAFKRGDNPPRFHYENRSFNIIQCNTDLNDSDCEVIVVRGVNFNVDNPKDVDTYVKIEFPYPSENPPQDRSYVVKDTNNPEYNHKIVFSIDRKSRALARVFKRHNVKIQVIAKGGWFHRDTTIGSVKVPLVILETKCTLHDSFDLTDDRKKMVGGKLEVKIRVRNPIVAKQLEKVTEKWLVIDGF
ncbi:coiled-coil and C2 domain-containing protein 1-like [Palaemon carinicauda]|uniref:coiled-coil and C2 domain-containing protein 1-like n=1 Tax=Palaemon carinicauda TaxID=392227 RepID=UPI0035B63D85